MITPIPCKFYWKSFNFKFAKYLLLLTVALTRQSQVLSQTCGNPLPSDSTSIALNSYNTCNDLTTVVIPSTVTFIGEIYFHLN